MLSYIFFHQKPFQLFISFLEGLNISLETSAENDCFEVAIPDDMSAQLSIEIEEEYDRLFELNQELMDSNPDDEKDYAMASIDVPLGDGTISQANIKPELINKILSVLNTQQLAEVVRVIVGAVENPDNRTFCERVREDDIFTASGTEKE